MAELFNRPIEVYVYSTEPINTFQAPAVPGCETYAPMRVSYHQGNHFNSIVDPSHPSVGVGLGLPGYKPVPVDRLVTASVVKQSEAEQVDSLLVSRAIEESDAAETEQAVERAILEASRLEFLRNLCSAIVVPPELLSTTAPAPEPPPSSSSTTNTTTSSSEHNP